MGLLKRLCFWIYLLVISIDRVLCSVFALYYSFDLYICRVLYAILCRRSSNFIILLTAILLKESIYSDGQPM